MKKLVTFVITMLVGASLAVAQAGGGTPGSKTETGDKPAPASGKKASKTRKTHKGKKGAKTGTQSPKTDLNPQPLPPGRHPDTTTTPPPK